MNSRFPRPLRLLAFWALAGCLLVATACRNGDDDDPIPDPEDTPVAYDPAEFVCTIEDVPPAFEYEQLIAGPADDEQVAAFATDPERRLEQLGEWDRVEGQYAAFSSARLAEDPEGVAYFECALDRFQAIEGAHLAFVNLAYSLDDTARLALEGQGFGEVEFIEIPDPQIGDETEALSGTASREGQPFEFFAVTFRRVNMVGYSLSAAPERFSFVEDAANISALMVKLIDERIEEDAEARGD